MILFGAGLRDGNKHDPHNLPLLVGGRGGGRIAAGQRLTYNEDTPLANLYVSMLDAFGTPVDRFADSPGRLPGELPYAAVLRAIVTDRLPETLVDHLPHSARTEVQHPEHAAHIRLRTVHVDFNSSMTGIVR